VEVKRAPEFFNKYAVGVCSSVMGPAGIPNPSRGVAFGRTCVYILGVEWSDRPLSNFLRLFFFANKLRLEHLRGVTPVKEGGSEMTLVPAQGNSALETRCEKIHKEMEQSRFDRR